MAFLLVQLLFDFFCFAFLIVCFCLSLVLVTLTAFQCCDLFCCKYTLCIKYAIIHIITVLSIPKSLMWLPNWERSQPRVNTKGGFKTMKRERKKERKKERGYSFIHSLKNSNTIVISFCSTGIIAPVCNSKMLIDNSMKQDGQCSTCCFYNNKMSLNQKRVCWLWFQL